MKLGKMKIEKIVYLIFLLNIILIFNYLIMPHIIGSGIVNASMQVMINIQNLFVIYIRPIIFLLLSWLYCEVLYKLLIVAQIVINNKK